MRPRSLPESSPGHLAFPDGFSDTFSDGFQRWRRHSFGGSFLAIRPGALAVEGGGPCRTAEEQSTDGGPCRLLGIDVQSDSR